MIDLRGKYIKYDETITEDVFDSKSYTKSLVQDEVLELKKQLANVIIGSEPTMCNVSHKQQ